MEEFDYLKHYSFRLPKELMDEFKMEIEFSTAQSSMTEALKGMIRNKVSTLRTKRYETNKKRDARLAEFEEIKTKKEAFLKARAEAMAERKAEREKKKKKDKKKKDKENDTPTTK